MGMTRSEHILARASGKARVAPGDMVVGKADVIMGNDITTSLTVRILDANGITEFADPDKVFIVMSHFVPAKDIASAAMAKTCRDFARQYDIKHYFEAGQGGIEHALLPDEGYVVPGDLVLGADSHSCTYGGVNTFATGIGSTDLAAAWTTGELWLRVPETIKIVFNGVPKNPWVSGKDVVLFLISRLGDDGALYQAQEFHGEGTSHLSVEGRLTIANMAIEGGAKNSIFPCDDKTLAYEAGRARRDFQGVEADADAGYAAVHEFDISNLEPQVAFPHLPSNCKPVGEAMQEKVSIDQVFIGSCTNAKLEDLRIAAKILDGHQLAKWTRGVVIPASHNIYMQALDEGLISIFAKAGFAVAEGTCGPCLGGYMGVIGEGERMLSTSNRNFKGRTGDTRGETYLVSPAVAAASAITG
ncbi:MAG: 3-isopropylmalate dehydratase large subunit, partial [Candidatus Tectomicrobia bacterium]|nr:3-isopropylmalate dehydratase large subunit [Candidatus Tectomicrobia bacterium]